VSQPLHTVVVGAHRVTPGLASAWGEAGLRVLGEYAPDGPALAAALGLELDGALAQRVHDRVVARLRTEPVADLLVDFEDGYGARSDAEEDGHAESAARALARDLAAGTAPRSAGLRIKALDGDTVLRAKATLERFVATLLEGPVALPEQFTVCLPKVTDAAHMATLADQLDELEDRHNLSTGRISIAFMVEHTATLIDAHGIVPLSRFVTAARGRCTTAHLGTFDLTASVGVPATHQHLLAPVCEMARRLMQVGLSASGTRVCDGSTHVLPLEPHQAADGERLSDGQRQQNRDVVHAGWRLHASHVQHAIEMGIRQGWDLHAHQLPARLAMTMAFYGQSLESAQQRIAALLASPDGSARCGAMQDDVATGQALLDMLRRGREVGAVDEAELLACGLTAEELAEPSFAAIYRGRATAEAPAEASADG
jgi:citrate lyase beta subunit